MTQEKVSERVGKSRTAITNYLRLLKLPAQVQMALQKKLIDIGHARALLSLDSPSQQIKLFKEIIKNGYSVRKVEALVKRLKKLDSMEGGESVPVVSPVERFDVLARELSGMMGTKIQFTCSSKGKGKISIPFANEDELVRLMGIFDKLKG